MSPEETAFFHAMPEMLGAYKALRESLTGEFPDVQIRVAKTQISFCNRHVFAMASLPWRRVRGWPEKYLLVSFGLPGRLDSPRVAQAVEPYPNRWTHHVLVEDARQIDAQLLGWLREAYWFSMAK